MSNPSECFTYATVFVSEQFSVVLVGETMQQLAAAWRALAGSKLDTSKVNQVRITK